MNKRTRLAVPAVTCLAVVLLQAVAAAGPPPKLPEPPPLVVEPDLGVRTRGVPKPPPVATLPARVPRNTTTTTTIPRDVTVTGGRRTTYTPPLPDDRYGLVALADCHHDGGTRCGSTKKGHSRFTPCTNLQVKVWTGPEPDSGDPDNRDQRISTSGRGIIINDALESGVTDPSGMFHYDYWWEGTQTVTRWSATTDRVSSVLLSTETNVPCTLYPWNNAGTRIVPLRVWVGVKARSGMTRAVAEYAPPQEWLDLGPQYTTWTCQQDDIDEGYPCTVGDVITTERPREFPTPRGCVVIVLSDDDVRGHGSTGCVTRDEAQAILDIQEGDDVVDLDDLPNCVEGVRPAGGERCIARN